MYVDGVTENCKRKASGRRSLVVRMKGDMSAFWCFLYLFSTHPVLLSMCTCTIVRQVFHTLKPFLKSFFSS